MYVLYLDESGDPTTAKDHFVVGGLAVHESGIARMRRNIEEILARHLSPELCQQEVHVQHIYKGKGVWRGVPMSVRAGLLADLFDFAGTIGHQQGAARLFAVVWSPGAVPSADPLERVFEEVLLRFHRLVGSEDGEGASDQQHGIVVCDKARYESLVQPLAMKWRDKGTRFSRLNRLAEVPLFVDSRHSRLTQLADLVVYAVLQCYARDDPDFMFRLIDGFEADVDGTLHGLLHLTPNHAACHCIACESRHERRARRDVVEQGSLFGDPADSAEHN